VEGRQPVEAKSTPSSTFGSPGVAAAGNGARVRADTCRNIHVAARQVRPIERSVWNSSQTASARGAAFASGSKHAIERLYIALTIGNHVSTNKQSLRFNAPASESQTAVFIAGDSRC
jgi:hypothetical protein